MQLWAAALAMNIYAAFMGQCSAVAADKYLPASGNRWQPARAQISITREQVLGQKLIIQPRCNAFLEFICQPEWQKTIMGSWNINIRIMWFQRIIGSEL